MTPFLQLALALAIIIAAAKAGGYLSYRLGQPSVLGELLVGIFLGPTVLNLLHISYFSNEHLSEVIHELAEIGVLLLMFIAGLELHLSDLAKSGKVSALAGVLGVIFPLVLGGAAAWLTGAGSQEAIFIGLTLAATSVSISAQTLMELKVLRSRVGIGLLGAAVFDDILVVLSLSIFTALIGSSGGLGQALLIALQMALYLAAGTVLGIWLIPRLSQMVSSLPISQGLIAFAIVTLLLYAWAAEELGQMAALTGAFLAGLMFARSPLRDRIEIGISALAYGLFVPIFFINVGLLTNARDLVGGIFGLFVLMTLVAIVGKIAGAGLGALWSGFNRQEALQLGIGMMSRGEVGLIVATVGVTQGVLPPATFSVVVGVVIITTLLTPPMLRASFRKPQPKIPAKTDAASPAALPPEGEES